MYSIACIVDGVCYASRTKLYQTEQNAKKALKHLQKRNNEKYSNYKVYEVRLFDLKK